MGGFGDADAGGDEDFPLSVPSVEDAEWAAGEIGTVEGAGDAEGLREFSWAAAEVFPPAPAGAHLVEAGKRLDGADEDTAGGAVGFNDDIETFVHAVDEVDVGVSRRAEDDPGAIGDSAGGVRGEVVAAEIGLNFNDASAGLAVRHDFA